MADMNNKKNTIEIVMNKLEKGENELQKENDQHDNNNNNNNNNNNINHTHILLHWRTSIENYANRNWTNIRKVIHVTLLLLYFIYFSFAISHSVHGAKALIIITSLVVAYVIYAKLRDKFGSKILLIIQPLLNCLARKPIIKYLLCVVILISFVLYLVLVLLTNTRKLRSLLGLIIFTSIPYLTSKHPRSIKWRPIIWGFAMQFIMGFLVLRWQHGYNAVSFLSDKLNQFLSYALDGGAQVFGNPTFLLHPFPTVIISLLVYLGAVTEVLFHWGVIEWLCRKMAFFMQHTARITCIEGFGLAVNIFLSVLETSVMLKPYMKHLTKSEFHTYLVGAHSTIAGWAFGLFVLIGINAQHLLTAAVMSAPAAVAIAKLSWPETQVSYFVLETNLGKIKSKYDGSIAAFCGGAYVAGKGVLQILCQVIAFLSFLQFADVTVIWFGERVGLDISLRIIFAYVFQPLPWLFGIDWSECHKVSSFLGLKVMGNEILAFIELSIDQDSLSDHAYMITIYALCGFSSFGTLAMFMAIWKSIDEKRVAEISQDFFRLLVNCNLACFTTACVAGILYDENQLFKRNKQSNFILQILQLIPSYKDIFKLIF